jgi:hypothetical protein
MRLKPSFAAEERNRDEPGFDFNFVYKATLAVILRNAVTKDLLLCF